MEITGNTEDVVASTHATKKDRWRPSGTIKVFDDVKQDYVPLKGVRVRARKWLKSSYGVTNAEGYFEGNRKFRRKVNYMIKWKKAHFTVRNGDYFQATHNGPKLRGEWNLNINGGKSLRFAHIFRAAHDYIYRNPFGTKQPPKNPGFSGGIRIGYNHKNGDAGFGAWRTYTFGIAPAIRVFKSKKNEDFSTEQIYAITAHEIAHAAHWKLIVDAPNSNRFRDFQSATLQFLENWATYMETKFTKYFVNTNYDRFIDIKETADDYYIPSSGLLVKRSDFFKHMENAAGLSSTQMEKGLIGSNSLKSWKNKMIANHPEKENIIESIFSLYPYEEY